jgi:hypothetical protein
VLLGGRDGELQQLAEPRSSGVMHRRTHRHLDRFQIETPGLAAIFEDDVQELIYFARDFLMDGFGCFFSCGVCSASSTGRKRQTLRLSSSSWLVRD